MQVLTEKKEENNEAEVKSRVLLFYLSIQVWVSFGPTETW